MKSALILLISLFLTSNLFAQKIDTNEFKEVKKEQVSQNPGTSVNNRVYELKPLSSWEFMLSLIVLGFGMIVILFEVFLIMKQKISAENTVRFIVVTLIITSTLFLITAGYDNNQIAPAMGLLGTIAGYLLGRQNNEKNGNKEI
jgi:uncharacterized membrane protein YfcA